MLLVFETDVDCPCIVIEVIITIRQTDTTLIKMQGLLLTAHLILEDMSTKQRRHTIRLMQRDGRSQRTHIDDSINTF